MLSKSTRNLPNFFKNQLIFGVSMGPIRGVKRRKKVENEVDRNAPPHTLVPSRPLHLDWWQQFSKRINGPLSKLKDSDKFETIFKMSRKTFEYICSLVGERMMARPANYMNNSSQLLCLNDRVAVALRRLSSGDSLTVVGESFDLNQTTVAQITWRFVEAIEESGLHHLQWPSTEAEMEEMKTKFERMRGLPNCCGAIDTTHIAMCLSTVDKSTKVWCNKEMNHTMVLQAIVDPDLRFRDVVSGWPGSLTESTILQSSSFFKLCEEGKRLNGKMEVSQGTELREYIIGNSGYPLLPWLLTPYRGKKLPEFQSTFNKRLLTTRLVAQRALIRLKENFKIIHGVMWMPDKSRLPRIILACCLLHNILIDLEDEVQKEMSYSSENDSDYRQQFCDGTDEDACVLREKLALYLSGKLP